LPIVEAAEKLGFVKVVDGECEITDLGIKVICPETDNKGENNEY